MTDTKDLTADAIAQAGQHTAERVANHAEMPIGESPLRMRAICYVDAWVDPGERITYAQAAELLGIGITTLKLKVARNELTHFIDLSKPPNRGRNVLLKSEIEQMAKDKAAELAAA